MNYTISLDRCNHRLPKSTRNSFYSFKRLNMSNLFGWIRSSLPHFVMVDVLTRYRFGGGFVWWRILIATQSIFFKQQEETKV